MDLIPLLVFHIRHLSLHLPPPIPDPSSILRSFSYSFSFLYLASEVDLHSPILDFLIIRYPVSYIYVSYTDSEMVLLSLQIWEKLCALTPLWAMFLLWELMLTTCRTRLQCWRYMHVASSIIPPTWGCMGDIVETWLWVNKNNIVALFAELTPILSSPARSTQNTNQILQVYRLRLTPKDLI